VVHVRLLQLTEELARVSRKGFDVAALALGEDGVEGQAGLTRAGDAGNHHQLVAGDFDRDIFEIVFARADDDDFFLGH